MQRPGYILIVDDSENDLELARRCFEFHKVANEFFTVRDGAEALDFLYRRGDFQSRPGGPPLFVMLDINMPKVSGIEVLEQIKGDPALSSTPVVMMTSSRQGPDVERCYRNGANAYVVKPVDFDQFDEAIRTIGKFWAVLNEVPIC